MRSVYFLFIGILVLLFFSACQNDIKDVEQVTVNKIFPTESSTNVILFHTDSAKPKLRLESPQVDHFSGKKPYIEMPKGVKLEFYETDGKVKTRLTCGYAIRRELERTMEAKQNVVVINEKGEQLNTEYLIWDESKEIISTNEFVKITTEEEVIFGDGLEATEDFSRYKILNIKGTINLKDSTLN
ncbi:MAG: LPS export ABC transporter periplasmic protein LptC [Bacteroidetes bacterium]|nr:LPS export ABC transporter periplasmic protein LptC [Bacteroidota bacterium]